MKKYLCCLAILALGPHFLVAGDLTVFGGFHHPGDVTLGDIGDTAGQLTDPKDFGVFGVRFNRSPAPIGLEHTFAYSPNFVDERANAFIYNMNLIAGIPGLSVRPYGTAGMGFIRAGGNGPAAFGSKFALNYGGGVKMSALGPLGLRVDVRGYRVLGVDSQSLNIFETSIGLVFGF